MVVCCSHSCKQSVFSANNDFHSDTNSLLLTLELDVCDNREIIREFNLIKISTI